MKRKIVSLFLVIMMIAELLVLTGCNNDNKAEFNGMTDIDTACIQALYMGGKHDAYYLDSDDVDKLEKIAKSKIEINKTEWSKIEDNGLSVGFTVICKNKKTYNFVMGKGKIYLELDRWITDESREMWEITDKEFYNFVDEVIKKCEDTDSTIVKDWAK